MKYTSACSLVCVFFQLFLIFSFVLWMNVRANSETWPFVISCALSRTPEHDVYRHMWFAIWRSQFFGNYMYRSPRCHSHTCTCILVTLCKACPEESSSVLGIPSFHVFTMYVLCLLTTPTSHVSLLSLSLSGPEYQLYLSDVFAVVQGHHPHSSSHADHSRSSAATDFTLHALKSIPGCVGRLVKVVFKGQSADTCQMWVEQISHQMQSE